MTFVWFVIMFLSVGNTFMGCKMHQKKVCCALKYLGQPYWICGKIQGGPEAYLKEYVPQYINQQRKL